MDFKPNIYWCADDFGISASSCDRITECFENGCLNKISVLPNSQVEDIAERIKKLQGTAVCIHLNFVEGVCVSDKKLIPLLTDSDGYFNNSFIGILKISLSGKRKSLKKQLKTEMKAQILRATELFGEKAPLIIDSHQHTHMIPLVFSALCEVIKEERLNAAYLRMPEEPVWPFLKFPSLYPQYISPNFLKHWLLKFLGLLNRKKFKALNIRTACFFGIMFSGNMNEKRVKKLIPSYLKYAARHKTDIEVLFHPGYISEDEDSLYFKDIKFKKFYLSNGRKNEYNALTKMHNI